MRRHGVALLVALALGAGGCATVMETDGQSVTISGDGIEINGVANEPTGEKVEAGRYPSPAGEFVLWTYPSKVGPCFDLVYPNGDRTAGCLASSGIDPDQPVAGGHPAPEFSHAINPAALNYGAATGADIGMVHHGVAHPVVAEIRLMATDGSAEEPLIFKPVEAPNIDDFHVFVAYAPAETKEYVLQAYDADGCLLDAIPTSVSGVESIESEEAGLHDGGGC